MLKKYKKLFFLIDLTKYVIANHEIFKKISKK